MRKFSQIKTDKDFPNAKVLTFLAKTTYPDSYYPNGYLYQFEINRITFTTLGTLKKTEDEDQTESKFLVAMFFIFRILIRDILLKPEQVLKGNKVKQTTKTYSNFLL